jgi:polyisoprenoid-binding protein YceI
MMLSMLALGAALVAGDTVAADPVTWTIDRSHSELSFRVRHLTGRVRGYFKVWGGTLTADPQQLAAGSVEVEVQTASINTEQEKRDAHLRSADFFDVEKFPAITFKSKRIEPASGGGFKVTGDLTMKGVTKEVVLDVEPLRPAIKDQRGASRTGTTATTKLNRQDYGVTWSRALDGGGVVVSDEVSVTIDIELISAPPAAK